MSIRLIKESLLLINKHKMTHIKNYRLNQYFNDILDRSDLKYNRINNCYILENCNIKLIQTKSTTICLDNMFIRPESYYFIWHNGCPTYNAQWLFLEEKYIFRHREHELSFVQDRYLTKNKDINSDNLVYMPYTFCIKDYLKKY